MLDFFRGAATGFLITFYILLLIASIVLGFVFWNYGLGLLIMLGGFIVSTLICSFMGTFLGMAVDISKIRKRIEYNQTDSISEEVEEDDNYNETDKMEETDETEESEETEVKDWYCGKCGWHNSGESLYCEKCNSLINHKGLII